MEVPMSRLGQTSLEPLEPYDGKLSSTVLRGESPRKGADLLDTLIKYQEKKNEDYTNQGKRRYGGTKRDRHRPADRKNEKRNQAPPGNRITSGPAFCSTRRALFPRQQTTTSDSRSSLRTSERSEANENLQWHCRTDHRSASRKDRSGNRETKGSRTSPNNAGFYGSKW